VMWCDAEIRHPEELSLIRTTPHTSQRRNVHPTTQPAPPNTALTADTVNYYRLTYNNNVIMTVNIG